MGGDGKGRSQAKGRSPEPEWALPPPDPPLRWAPPAATPSRVSAWWLCAPGAREESTPGVDSREEKPRSPRKPPPRQDAQEQPWPRSTCLPGVIYSRARSCVDELVAISWLSPARTAVW